MILKVKATVGESLTIAFEQVLNVALTFIIGFLKHIYQTMPMCSKEALAIVAPVASPVAKAMQLMEVGLILFF